MTDARDEETIAMLRGSTQLLGLLLDNLDDATLIQELQALTTALEQAAERDLGARELPLVYVPPQA